MTPSQQCKQSGLKSLAELSRLAHTSEQNLINWHKKKPEFFEVLVIGAAEKKRQEAIKRSFVSMSNIFRANTESFMKAAQKLNGGK